MNAISPAFTPSSSPTIPTGPHQIATNDRTGDVFVSNQANASVSMMNARRDVVSASLPGVAPGTPLHMRLSSADNSAVVLVDTPAGPAERDCLYKVTAGPTGLRVDGPLPVENGDYTQGFDVDGQSGAVFLGNNRSGNLHRFVPGPSGRLTDPATTRQTAPLEPGASHVAFDPLSQGVFVVNQDRGQVRHVSAQAISNPLPVGLPGAYKVAVNHSRGTLAVLNETERVLHKLSPDGSEQRWNVQPGTHRLVAHDGNGAFLVLNKEAGTVQAFLDTPVAQEPITFRTGRQPVDAVVDTPLSTAFVLNSDATLTVITPDGQLATVPSVYAQAAGVTFPTLEPGGRQALTVNGTTHEVFLANEASATITRVSREGATVHALNGQR